ncbi:MAG: hypothetical protein IJY14_03835 [Acholeplasmatales bacterium]|nr:hypothetical protein [Acholeplasmatales bacterium]
MGLWNSFKIKNNNEIINGGISLHFEKGIEEELRNEYIDFVKWLRKKYIFPIHINVYILNCERVKLLNGNLAYGSFRWFKKRTPMIRIPSLINYNDYIGLTKEEIYITVMSSLIHELTHYYQYVKKLEQTDKNSERQADYYRFRIIELFYEDKKIINRFEAY